tara:strand:+ start:128 stop:307 length:180 start_codon:yes stop_codon:yes gene_type:complete
MKRFKLGSHPLHDLGSNPSRLALYKMSEAQKCWFYYLKKVPVEGFLRVECSTSNCHPGV